MLSDEDYFEDEMREEAMNDADAILADIEYDNGALCSACGDRICTLDKAKGFPTWCKDCWEVHGL